MFPHWKVEEPSNKKPKKGDDKSAVLIVKKCVRQLSWVPQRVRFSRGALRQANIREKGPSLGKIQVIILHLRSSYVMRFEDISPGETARKERCAGGDAWKFATNIFFKFKKEDKATFCSTNEKWILQAASTLTPEEREFVVDSGASMHMVCKKRP